MSGTIDNLMPRTTRQWVVVFVLLSCLNACLVFVAVPQLIKLAPGDYYVGLFPDGYDLIAENLVSGNGYRFYPETSPTLYRVPGYIFLLALLFGVFGKNLFAAQLLNVLIVSLTAVIIMKLSRVIVDHDGVSFFAALLFLFHPATILSESRAGVENLMTLGVTLFLYILYRALDARRTRLFVLAGITFGLSLLVKQSHLFFVVLIVPLVFYRAAKEKALPEAARNLMVMFLCAGAVYCPWVVRNYMVSGEFVPTMTVRGSASFQGLHINISDPGEDVQRRMNNAARRQNVIAREAGYNFREGYMQHFYKTSDEVAFDKLLYGIVVREYTRNPALLVSTAMKNSLRFWFQGRTRKATMLNVVIVLPYLCLALAGVVVGLRRRLKIVPMLVLIVAFMIPHLPMIALARHQTPLIPVLCILGCLPLLLLTGTDEVPRRRLSEGTAPPAGKNRH